MPDCCFRTAILGALCLALGAGAAAADTYPSKPIMLVVGFPPGGSNDVVARIIAPKASEFLGTPIVIDNRPGANATIGTQHVAKAAPDGYTITLGSASPLAISPHTYPDIPYDTLKDPAGDLAAMGFKLVLYANLVLRSSVKAIQASLQHLRERGDTRALSDAMITMDERARVTRKDLLDELEARYVTPSA
jgi:tripartite-type tricarboxylate transporter receptor subunit TctC